MTIIPGIKLLSGSAAMTKVYISSTFEDLKDHRAAVYGTLRKMRLDVIAMEDYVASDSRPLDKCLNDIDSSDIYILIVAWRYGFIPEKDNPLQKSITELEYRHAKNRGKTCLSFILSPQANWSPMFMDRGASSLNIDSFRDELANDNLISFFSEVDELTSLVSTTIFNLGLSGIAMAPSIIHNLPQPDYGTFIGREEEVQQLCNLISTSSRHFLVTIDGIGGIGKSALALEVAHMFLRGSEEIPETERFAAIIWITAKERELSASGIIARRLNIRTLRDIFITISIALKREDITRTDFENQLELVRGALTQQRTLLIIDNLEAIYDESVLEFLRDLPDPTKAIITTRHRIDVAFPMRLVGLPFDDAKSLISQECQKKGVTALSREESTKLYDRTGGVPLALVWSISQLSAGYSIEVLMQRLSQPNNDIAKFCFDGVVDLIRSSDAYRLLLAAALFSADVTREAVGIVAGFERDLLSRDEGLVKLETLSLINRTNGRYGLLPLTRQFALAELSSHPEHEKFRERWRTWLMEFAQNEHPSYWYEFKPMNVKDDIPILEEGLEWASANKDWELFLKLVVVVCWYYNYSGLWSELITKSEFAIEIARENSDLETEAEMRSALLGFAYSQQHDFVKAIHHGNIALNIYRDKLHSSSGEAIALAHLAQVYRKQGDFNRAETLYEQASEILSRRTELHRTYIAVQFELGKLARDKGEWANAYQLFDKVRQWLDENPDDVLNQTQLQGAIYGHLALVEFYRKNYEQAKSFCLEGIRLFTIYDLRVAFGSLYWRLAVIEDALGNYAEASEAVRLAIDWFDRLGMNEDKRKAEVLKEQITANLNKERPN
jgi:tetratricopeptide (TPR) repeat protein